MHAVDDGLARRRHANRADDLAAVDHRNRDEQKIFPGRLAEATPGVHLALLERDAELGALRRREARPRRGRP